MKNLVTILILVLSCNLFAQNAPPPPTVPSDKIVWPPDTSSGEVLQFAHEMPQFPGGEAEFHKYLQRNIHYPDSAKKYKKQGTVYVYFEVYKDGTIKNVRCQKGVVGAPELCQEAVRVISTMPKWEPGKMDSKNVTVSMTVPLKFTLD